MWGKKEERDEEKKILKLVNNDEQRTLVMNNVCYMMCNYVLCGK